MACGSSRPLEQSGRPGGIGRKGVTEKEKGVKRVDFSKTPGIIKPTPSSELRTGDLTVAGQSHMLTLSLEKCISRYGT